MKYAKSKVFEERTRGVDYMEVTKGAYVYRSTEHRTLSDASGHVMEAADPIMRQGFVSESGLERLLSGAPYSNIEWLGYMCNGRLAALRDWGFQRAMWGDDNLSVDAFIEEESRPFEAYAEGRATEENLVVVRNSSHQVFGIDDAIKPTAMHADYIKARFSNDCYDVEALALLLLARDDVVIFADTGRNEGPKIAETVDEAISRIPYYNASDFQSHYVRCLWRPSREQMQAMWERAQEIDTKYPSTKMWEAAFDLDCLGLRKGGAALFDEFWGSRSNRLSDEPSEGGAALKM